MALVLLLTSCYAEMENQNLENQISDGKNPYSKELMNAIDVAKESEKKVDLYLEEVDSDENSLTVRLMMRNENATEIKSIRSFISYNPEVLEGISISLSEDLGGDVLIAPSEKEFDAENGIAKIGLSVKTSDRYLEIAEISFKKLADEGVILDFFNPQRGGHTEVIGIFDGHIKNLLRESESPAFVRGDSDE